MIHHINKLKDKNHMISIDAENKTLAKKNIKREMHIKMMYKVATFI